MTKKKVEASLESQLHELYTSPDPDPAFTHLLRVRILEKAQRQQRLSWFAQLWDRISSIGRFGFGLAGVALLTVLVLLGSTLLARQLSIPEEIASNPQGVNATQQPVETTQPSTTTPESVYKLPQLAPSACDTIVTPESQAKTEQMPKRLIGGGVVQSGDYQISLYLICDDSFYSDTLGSYSEIPGLGIYEVAWQENTVLGKPRAYTRPLNLGEYLPDPSVSEIPVRYVFRITSDAQLYSAASTTSQIQGAALTFKLVKRVDGMVVENIEIEPLTHNQLSPDIESVAIARSVPTQEPASLNPLLGELKSLQELQKIWLYNGPGWIRYSEQRKVAGMENDPAIVTWYEMDINGSPIRYVSQETMPWGKNPPTTKTRTTVWVSSGEEIGGIFSSGRLTFDMGVYKDAVMAIKQGGSITRQEIPEGIEYTITTEIWEIKAVFDPQNGSPIKYERYDVTRTGKKNLTSRKSEIMLERVDEPPSDIMTLLE